jgi:hypothetical protein
MIRRALTPGDIHHRSFFASNRAPDNPLSGVLRWINGRALVPE